jgi:23S rRNA (pseudouridine1915-N3)-methyltransferase
MKFRVVAVGKPRDRAVAAAIEAYEVRAARYWPLETSALPDERARERSSDAVRRREGERILKALDASSTVIACDERGKSIPSVAFARWLQALRERAVDVAFVIGGAQGLDDAVRTRSATLLALAPWTLSHDLARLVLAEQLYRAGTIVRGEPYHK